MIPRHITEKKQEWLKYISAGQPHLLGEAVLHLHPADQLEVIRTLGKNELAEVLNVMEDSQICGILRYYDPDNSTRRGIVSQLAEARRVSVLGMLAPDVAAGILAGLAPGEAADTLAGLPVPAATEIQEFAAAERHGADRIMTRDYLFVRADETVHAMLDTFRSMTHTEGRPAQVYVVDHRGVLCGVIELHLLLPAQNEDKLISEIMKECPLRISSGTDSQEAAHNILYYGLGSGPVVNRTGELLGVVTAEAAYRLLEERLEASLNCIGALGRMMNHGRAESFGGAMKRAFAIAPIMAAALAASLALQLVLRLIFPRSPEAYIFAWAPLATATARLFYWHISLLLQKFDSSEKSVAAQRSARVKAALLTGAVLSPVCGVFAWLLTRSPRMAIVVAAGVLCALASGSFTSWALFGSKSRMKLFRSPYLTPSILSAADFSSLVIMAILFYLLAGLK